MFIDIRDYVEQLRNERGLTHIELSRKLEYRSKTSLARLMRGEADIRSLESFGTRVKAHLNPSAEELRILQRILQTACSNDLQSILEMEAFLQMEAGKEEEILLSVPSGRQETLAERYEGAREIRCILLNCQYVPIYPVLRRWIDEKGTQVKHYMMNTTDAARTIHTMTVLLPIICNSSYCGYGIQQNRERPGQGLQASDIMIVSWRDDQDQCREDFIVFDRPKHGNLLTSNGHGLFIGVLGMPWDGYLPIKRTYFHSTVLEDYRQYSLDYAVLEDNCAHYIIKPDLCIALIPTAVLRAAFIDRCPDADAQLVDALVEIYDRRFGNVIQKHKPTHYVLKRKAMWRFAQTGQTQDHFWGMRPYTVEERIRILEHLIQQIRENPYFNLYFLLDDDALRDIQIGYYEGKGLLILDAKTSFNLAQGHSEILITQNEFLNLYKDYYMKILLKDAVTSQGKTLAILQEHLNYCRYQLERAQSNVDANADLPKENVRNSEE